MYVNPFSWWNDYREAKQWVKAEAADDTYGLWRCVLGDDSFFGILVTRPDVVLDMREYYKGGRTPKAAYEMARQEHELV